MGDLKQLHIDCYEGTCEVNYWETCYMQIDNPSYYSEVVEINGTTCPTCSLTTKTLAGLSKHMNSKHSSVISDQDCNNDNKRLTIT